MCYASVVPIYVTSVLCECAGICVLLNPACLLHLIRTLGSNRHPNCGPPMILMQYNTIQLFGHCHGCRSPKIIGDGWQRISERWVGTGKHVCRQFKEPKEPCVWTSDFMWDS